MEIQSAQVVLGCRELDPTLEFFTKRLGFRLEEIQPADEPEVAVVSGHGLRIRLERNGSEAPGLIRLTVADPEALSGAGRELVAPNGTRILLDEADPPLATPEIASSFVVTRYDGGAAWRPGRAGMLYRDLIPDRQGGSFIASHIRIPEGGPVPDYVHYHEIRFQMIYCHRGWARVVYEDQGPPFVLRPGDCVLQPPAIRHRVLESSPGLEVIEIGHPAAHRTRADHGVDLPTPRQDAARDFGGQRFVRHEARRASWRPWRLPGFECRDTGIAAATDGLATVRVARPSAEPPGGAYRHDADFLFGFVLAGALTLRYEDDAPRRLEAGDCFVLPAERRSSFEDATESLELLEVALPAAFGTRPA